MRVMITGGTGFVGYHTALALIYLSIRSGHDATFAASRARRVTSIAISASFFTAKVAGVGSASQSFRTLPKYRQAPSASHHAMNTEVLPVLEYAPSSAVFIAAFDTLTGHCLRFGNVGRAYYFCNSVSEFYRFVISVFGRQIAPHVRE